ncbi:hypothetical protein B0H11DRAFT_1867869 [Mycena galericulata]|nr:hypothetical protein B0H11DRAFT_1867869 [Mycena galericulata]
MSSVHDPAVHPRPASSSSVAAAMPSYYRALSPNELSYFLPSRSYGLNDMFLRLIVRAPPQFISPLRLRIVWAIMRLRHTLLACQVEMEPGCYDGARFKYTPPSSPYNAVEEAGDTVAIRDDITGPELIDSFLDPDAPRLVSSERISRLYVMKHGAVSPGLEEYHFVLMMMHAVNDGLAVHQHCDMIFELLCGSTTPGGRPRTDVELAHLLDLEWKMRWGEPRVGEVIVPATEDRFPSPRSKFQQSAWRVDHQNVQRRAIGGHALPRVKSKISKQAIKQEFFDVQETAAILAKCKSRRVTLANVAFALCNFAWIRTTQNHPELGSSKTLPMMVYTAVSLRRFLPITSPLSSYMSLALGYCNIVLPSFIPRLIDPHAMFWHRARSAQSQVSAFNRSPLLRQRSQMMGVDRGLRAKAFAKMDDEADGTVPRSTEKPSLAPTQLGANANAVPSIALMGISCLGDLGEIYRAERYPSLQLVEALSNVRKARGGILMFTQILNKQFSMTLGWDAAGFPPGFIEEFWGNFVGGVHEFILESSSKPRSRL